MPRRRTPDPLAPYAVELTRALNNIARASTPAVRTDIATRLNLTAIIFANGEDDDLPGLVAAIENRPVLFDEKVYQPGEQIIIERRRLRISRPLVLIGSNGERPPGEWVEVRWPESGRLIELLGPIDCDRSAEP